MRADIGSSEPCGVALDIEATVSTTFTKTTKSKDDHAQETVGSLCEDTYLGRSTKLIQVSKVVYGRGVSISLSPVEHRISFVISFVRIWHSS